MKILNFCLLVVALFVSYQSEAQKISWKKRAKIGDELVSKGDYIQAAEYYFGAWQDKKEELILAYKAGDAYLKIRDYASALKCFEPIKSENKTFDKPGFKYALCLKQSGEYTKAKREFEVFGLGYNGTDYKEFESIVKNEIAGCDYALDLEKRKPETTEIINILDSKVNTQYAEFAPIPFEADDKEILYFSSRSEGASKIYKSEKKNDVWSARAIPNIFTKLEKSEYGNGSFTADGNRFYFTQCEIVPEGKSMCNIYLIEKDEKGFSAPIKLPDFINTPGATTTQPFVTVVEDREWLFFVSNREGGRGGLDIWYVTKSASAKGVNFTLPINLGTTVNTPQDEITPFYDPAVNTLYFSSNGHVGLGGLDIFKTEGFQTRWGKPQNLGYPVNSCADDLYYILKASGSGGYFVSNRNYLDKGTTMNDDIFSFSKKEISAVVKGKVTSGDEEAGSIPNAKVSLFEMVEGKPKLVSESNSPDGEYEFTLVSGKKYVIEATQGNYKMSSIELNTEDMTQPETLEQNVVLQKKSPAEKVVPMTATAENPYIVSENPPTNSDTRSPYAEDTEVYKKWLEAVAISKKSADGTVYYNEKGEMVAANPIPEKVAEPIAVTEPKNDKTNVSPTKGTKNTKKTKSEDKTSEPVAVTEPKSEKPTPTKNKKDTKKVEETEPVVPFKATEPFATNTETPASTPVVESSNPEDDKVVEGVEYKVQIAAIQEFKERHYAKAAKYGSLDTEVVTEPRSFIRVVIVGFDTVSKAREALKKLKKKGYDDAFIQKYEGGNRVGDGFQ